MLIELFIVVESEELLQGNLIILDEELENYSIIITVTKTETMITADTIRTHLSLIHIFVGLVVATLLWLGFEMLPYLLYFNLILFICYTHNHA